MSSIGMHQVLAGAAPRDAITNHALLARDVMRSRGWRSEIFCDDRHLAMELAGHVHPHVAWPRMTRHDDHAILHYSINSVAFSAVQDQASRTAVHYHNITPPELLWRDAPALAAQCAEGRRGLPAVVARSLRAAADSHFNAAELELLGAHDVATVGIMRNAPSRHLGPLGQPAATPGVRLLFVGRIVPNKCQHDLILATAALRESGVEATLDLVGSPGGNRPYLERCQRLADTAGVADVVTFHGSISDERLHALYAEADLFLCLSEHEGYCVPLLEAMDHDLPIIAYQAGAVPETLGGAGLILDDKAPSMVSEAIREVLANESLGTAMRAERQGQLEHHSAEAVARRMNEFLDDFVEC